MERDINLRDTNTRFLIEHFTEYLQTAKKYRLRVPIAISILNLALVSFVYGNANVQTQNFSQWIFVTVSLIIMLLGIIGLRAIQKSYERFLTALEELHKELGSKYASVYEAKEIWRYSYFIVVVVGILSVFALWNAPVTP